MIASKILPKTPVMARNQTLFSFGEHYFASLTYAEFIFYDITAQEKPFKLVAANNLPAYIRQGTWEDLMGYRNQDALLIKEGEVTTRPYRFVAAIQTGVDRVRSLQVTARLNSTSENFENPITEMLPQLPPVLLRFLAYNLLVSGLYRDIDYLGSLPMDQRWTDVPEPKQPVIVSDDVAYMGAIGDGAIVLRLNRQLDVSTGTLMETSSQEGRNVPAEINFSQTEEASHGVKDPPGIGDCKRCKTLEGDVETLKKSLEGLTAVTKKSFEDLYQEMTQIKKEITRSRGSLENTGENVSVMFESMMYQFNLLMQTEEEKGMRAKRIVTKKTVLLPKPNLVKSYQEHMAKDGKKIKDLVLDRLADRSSPTFKQLSVPVHHVSVEETPDQKAASQEETKEKKDEQAEDRKKDSMLDQGRDEARNEAEEEGDVEVVEEEDAEDEAEDEEEEEEEDEESGESESSEEQSRKTRASSRLKKQARSRSGSRSRSRQRKMTASSKRETSSDEHKKDKRVRDLGEKPFDSTDDPFPYCGKEELAYRLPVLDIIELTSVGLDERKFVYLVNLIDFVDAKKAIQKIFGALIGKHTPLFNSLTFEAPSSEDSDLEQFPPRLFERVINFLVLLYQGSKQRWAAKIRNFFHNEKKPTTTALYMSKYCLEKEMRTHFAKEYERAKTFKGKRSDFQLKIPQHFDYQNMYQTEIPETDLLPNYPRLDESSSRPPSPKKQKHSN